MPFMKVYLIRHGETNENKNSVVQGHLDTILNDEGKEQARLVAKALEEIPFDFAHTSDLKRAAETAEAILAYHPGVRLDRQKELRERCMGKLEGQKYDVSRAHRLVRSSLVDETAESADEFKKRILEWWNDNIKKQIASLSLTPKEGGYHVLAVSHGGWVSTLVRDLIQRKEMVCAEGAVVGKCFNASVTVVDVERDVSGTLVQYAGIEHLKARDAPVLENNADEAAA